MPVRGMRLLACFIALFAILLGFGWGFDQDTGRAVGLVAAALLAFFLSTMPEMQAP